MSYKNYSNVFIQLSGFVLLIISTAIFVSSIGRLTTNIIIPFVKNTITTNSNKTLSGDGDHATNLISPEPAVSQPSPEPAATTQKQEENQSIEETASSPQEPERELSSQVRIPQDNASSDCEVAQLAKAGLGPTYCSQAVFEQTEKNLNESYQKLKQKLTENQSSNLRQLELKWIKERQEKCGKGSDSTTQYCLAHEANTRIEWLEKYTP